MTVSDHPATAQRTYCSRGSSSAHPHDPDSSQTGRMGVEPSDCRRPPAEAVAARRSPGRRSAGLRASLTCSLSIFCSSSQVPEFAFAQSDSLSHLPAVRLESHSPRDVPTCRFLEFTAYQATRLHARRRDNHQLLRDLSRPRLRRHWKRPDDARARSGAGRPRGRT